MAHPGRMEGLVREAEEICREGGRSSRREARVSVASLISFAFVYLRSHLG